MELVLYGLCVILLVSSLCLPCIFGNARRNLPPGPRPWPLIGNLLNVGAQPHRSLARLAQRHGPLMTLHLGAVPTIVASSSDAAREILQRHDAAFSAHSVPDAVRACGHDRLSVIWLPSSSPEWRALRRLCSAELFAPHRLDAQQHLRSEKVNRLVSHVARLAREGAVVDVGRVVFTTVLNLFSSTVFTVDLDDGRGESAAGKFKDLITEFSRCVGMPNVSDFFPAVAPLDPQRVRKRLARVFARLHAVFDEQIERRMRDRAAGEPPKNDFLDVLLDYRSTEGRSFNRQTMLSLFKDLFAAATDTTTSSVEWVMAELLRNPASMAKAREELVRVIGSKPEIEESDIRQLDYLQAVVKETFRLHPPAPLLLPHRAEETTKNIGGYTVPKGARILVNVWAIGRDSKVWCKPDEFIPERFLQRDVDFRGHDFDLLPFGSGRRICPGMPLAVRIMHLMLASLLHRFEWTLPLDVEKKELDMAEDFRIVLVLATPLQAIATPVVHA